MFTSRSSSLNETETKKKPNYYEWTCVHCGKGYKTKSNVDKHLVLCETIVKARKKSSGEEVMDLPSQKQMYQIILDLTLKYNRMEEKLEQMQKWVNQKKKKFNVMEWLSTHQMPEIDMEQFTKEIIILEEEAECIMHHPFLYVLNEIVDRILSSPSSLPLFAFVQKPNVLYVVETQEHQTQEQRKWKEWTKEEIIYFLNIVHFQLVKAFKEWKKKNEDKINASDAMMELYNNAWIKMMSVQFNKQDSLLSKIRTMMYHKIKTDMKSFVEYEFEF
jgi:hypothetical protein